MRSLLLPLLLVTALVGGCTARLTPPKVEVEAGGPVTVEVKGPDDRGRFCPPGQQKKGRC